MMNLNMKKTDDDDDSSILSDGSSANYARNDSSDNSSKFSSDGGSTNLSGTKSSSNGSSSGQDEGGNLKKQLARKESDHINRSRVIVFLILILAAAGVSVLVYIISKNSDEDEFETQFEGASQQLLEAFDAIRTDRISAMSALAVASIAHGVDHIRTWPFVTLSSFQQRSFTARANSGILQISINPIVDDSDRREWEKFIVNETMIDTEWIPNALNYQGFVGHDQYIVDYGPSFLGENIESQPVSVYIYDDDADIGGDGTGTFHRETLPHGEGPYLPFWEMSPLLNLHDVNVDIGHAKHHKSHTELCLQTSSVVLGGMEMRDSGGKLDAPPLSDTSKFASLLSIAEEREVQYQGDPMTYVYLPIFDNFTQDRKAIAIMLGLFNWATYFKDVLPPNVEGIDVVLHNPCYESYTYRVSDDAVIPLGKGVSKSVLHFVILVDDELYMCVV